MAAATTALLLDAGLKAQNAGGGVLVVEAALFIEKKLKIDDPVGAISVHGLNGLWGMIALGLFANGSFGAGANGVATPVRGLFYGDASQLAAECIGVLTCIAWVGTITFVTFKVIGAFTPARTPLEDEHVGLDVPEMGLEGYATELGE